MLLVLKRSAELWEDLLSRAGSVVWPHVRKKARLRQKKTFFFFVAVLLASVSCFYGGRSFSLTHSKNQIPGSNSFRRKYPHLIPTSLRLSRVEALPYLRDECCRLAVVRLA